MSSTFSLECCECKEGPVGPQIGPLAFNRLRTPPYSPILSPPTTPITTMCNIITLTKKAAQKVGCLKVFNTQFWLMNRQVPAVNFISSAPGSYNTIIT